MERLGILLLAVSASLEKVNRLTTMAALKRF